MSGVLTSRLVDVKINGTWTAIGSYIDGAIETSVGRQTPADGLTPGSIKFTLRNVDGRFMPDNPVVASLTTGALSPNPLYPYFVRGAQIRFRYAGSDAVTRYGGPVYRITEIKPVLAGRSLADAVVEVYAADAIADCYRADLSTDFVEWALISPRSGAVGVMTRVDLWEPSDTASPTTLRNIGEDNINVAGEPEGYDAYAQGVTGTISSGSTSGAVFADCISLEPAEAARAAPSDPFTFGRAMVYPFGVVPLVIQFWMRIPEDAEFPEAGGPAYLVLGGLYDGGRNLLATFRWYNATNTIEVWSAAGSFACYFTESYIHNSNPRDGSWRCFTIYNGGGSTWVYSDATIAYAYSDNTIDVSLARYLVLGGLLNDGLAGNARLAPALEIGPAYATDLVAGGVISGTYGLRTQMRASERAQVLLNYGMSRNIIATYSTTTADIDAVPWVERGLQRGQSIGEALDIALRSGDGAVYCPTGIAEDMRLLFGKRDGANSVAFTVTLGADDHIPAGALEMASSFEDRPSRVTVSFPSGEATLIDTVAEASGVFQDASASTWSWDAASALTPAGRLLGRGSPALWIRSITLDLATSVTNLWAIPETLRPLDRIRIAGLPTSHFGRTSLDFIVQGWSCSFETERVILSLELSPAYLAPILDSSVPADDKAPRIAQDEGTTLSTALATTSGTTVVIATTGTPFTTTPGSYPMVVTIDGEDITLGSAPGGGTSPQTFTGCTRGVSPTVASTHTAGVAVRLRDAAIL